MFSTVIAQGALLLFLILMASAAIGAFIEFIESLEKKAGLDGNILSKLLRLNIAAEMSGWGYLFRLIGVSVGVAAFVMLGGLLQNLPLLKALHLGVAVATHTNWQPWAPETDLRPLTQLLFVLPGNLIIGAVCVAAWRALTRAFARKALGNAWAGIGLGLIILLPLTLILSVIQVTQGVSPAIALFDSAAVVSGAGAGWMSASFASAVQNPTVICDVASLVFLIAVPLGFCLATGGLIKRRGLIISMVAILLLALSVCTAITFNSTKPQESPGASWTLSKALWLNATAGSANGSVNAAPEAFEPAGRLPPFLLLLAGVPFPPAVGLGVGVLLMYLLVAVYLASLMVGRSPDFLGFKIRVAEVTSTAIGLLGPQIIILLTAAALVFSPEVLEILKTNGAYGMSGLLWAIGSWAQNNGSAYSLILNHDIFVETSIVVMTLGRLFTLGAVVIFAGQISAQRNDPEVPASVNPQTFVMIGFWLCVVFIGAVLGMLPALLMGPILEVMEVMK